MNFLHGLLGGAMGGLFGSPGQNNANSAAQSQQQSQTQVLNNRAFEHNLFNQLKDLIVNEYSFRDMIRSVNSDGILFRFFDNVTSEMLEVPLNPSQMLIPNIRSQIIDILNSKPEASRRKHNKDFDNEMDNLLK